MSPFSGLHNLINNLLPFTRPGTPLVQDIVHTIAICAVLYYLPQLTEWQQRRRQSGIRMTSGESPNAEQDQHNEESLRQQEGNAFGNGIDGEGEAPGDQVIGEDADEFEGVRRAPQANALPDEIPDAHPPQQQQQQQQPRRPRDMGNVGAKKAKSLARRERRRAYHEFVRNQADQQRAADASIAEEREAALSAEKERRAQAERRLDAQRDRDRKSAKAVREAREQRERERRTNCEEILKERLREEGAVDLMEVAEELFIDDVFAMKLSDEEADKVWQEKLVWVERLARAIPGLVGRKVSNDGETVITMVTASRWIVRIDRAVMDAAYQKAELLARHEVRAGGLGRVEMTQFGHLLEDVLMVSAGG